MTSLITIPPFLMLVLASRQSAPMHAWRWRGGALLLAGMTFVVFSSPVLRVYTDGGGASMSHAAFLGMMRPVESVLGISNGGLYEIGYGLEDSYAAAVISGYASRAAARLGASRVTVLNMTLPQPATDWRWCECCRPTH